MRDVEELCVTGRALLARAHMQELANLQVKHMADMQPSTEESASTTAPNTHKATQHPRAHTHRRGVHEDGDVVQHLANERFKLKVGGNEKQGGGAEWRLLPALSSYTPAAE